MGCKDVQISMSSVEIVEFISIATKNCLRWRFSFEKAPLVNCCGRGITKLKFLDSLSLLISSERCQKAALTNHWEYSDCVRGYIYRCPLNRNTEFIVISHSFQWFRNIE